MSLRFSTFVIQHTMDLSKTQTHPFKHKTEGCLLELHHCIVFHRRKLRYCIRYLLGKNTIKSKQGNMLPTRFGRKKTTILPSSDRLMGSSRKPAVLPSSSRSRMFKLKEKVIIATVATATFLCLWYDAEFTQSILRALHSRRLAMSLNLGNGTCEWRPALQYYDAGFPSDAEFHKTIIAGYPSGDKRLTFIQLEGLTGLSARDEWEFKFLGSTNQPFIKANYPHHEGIWGWGDFGDQVILVVSEMKRVIIEYHDILWVGFLVLSSFFLFFICCTMSFRKTEY